MYVDRKMKYGIYEKISNKQSTVDLHFAKQCGFFILIEEIHINILFLN